jgi:hypothetical protein
MKEIEDYYKEMGNGQKKRNYYDIFYNLKIIKKIVKS